MSVSLYAALPCRTPPEPASTLYSSAPSRFFRVVLIASMVRSWVVTRALSPIFASTVEVTTLVAQEPLKPTAEAWIVFVWLSKRAVCCARMDRLDTSSVVRTASAVFVSSATAALVELVAVTFDSAPEPATRPPLPASDFAKL